MKVMTVKLNPKTVFGLILVAAGVLVVLLTFLANHVKTGDAAPSAAEPAGLTCADVQAGARLLTDMGCKSATATKRPLPCLATGTRSIPSTTPCNSSRATT